MKKIFFCKIFVEKIMSLNQNDISLQIQINKKKTFFNESDNKLKQR